MADLFGLGGKIAVVLGGGGGIGESVALGLSQQGARVAIASRNLMKLEEKAKKMQADTSNEVVAFQVDVNDEKSVAQLVDRIISKFGTVDILVNVQGANVKRAAVEFPMEDWEMIFKVNVEGTMMSCKHFGKVMVEKKSGKIVNTSSVRGIRGHPGGNSGYCATKGAVDMITRALALEWAPHNVHVNAVAPSLVATELAAVTLGDPERLKKYIASVPLGKVANPEDVVGPFLFLASPASDFMTGQVIYVDGGLTA
jgi:gluconate 5-dehydrogenase